MTGHDSGGSLPGCGRDTGLVRLNDRLMSERGACRGLGLGEELQDFEQRSASETPFTRNIWFEYVFASNSNPKPGLASVLAYVPPRHWEPSHKRRVWSTKICAPSSVGSRTIGLLSNRNNLQATCACTVRRIRYIA